MTLPKKFRVEYLIFILFFFAGSYFYYPVDYDNTSSRLYLVSSFVDFGVFHIDPYASMTTDKSRGGDHFYSNKAIGAPLLAVPAYWLLRQIEPWEESPPLTRTMRFVIRLFAATLPFAFLGVMLFRIGRAWTGDGRASLRMVLAYGLGTIALIHASQLSGHGTAAAFSIFAFGGLICLRATGRESSEQVRCSLAKTDAGGVSGCRTPWSQNRTSLIVLAALAGLSAGFAALCDYTAAYTAGLLALYALGSPMPRRYKITFIGGGILCALVLAAYNHHCFGTPFSLSYGNLVTEKFAGPSKEGFLGITRPKANVLGDLIFSPGRGLFNIMPVLVFSVPGMWNMFRRHCLRKEATLILMIALGYLMINGGFYGWHGGWTYGPRYLIPMLPFLGLSMAFAPRAPLLFWSTLLVSALQVNQAAISLPHTPEQILNPLVELIIPFIGQGYLAETWPGWLGLPTAPSMVLYAVTTLFLSWLAWRTLLKEEMLSKEARRGIGHCPDKKFVISPLTGSGPRHHIGTGTSAHRDWPLKLCIVLWLGVIALMLNVVHTKPPWLVGYYQARMIFHLQNKDRIYDHVTELAVTYRREHVHAAD